MSVRVIRFRATFLLSAIASVIGLSQLPAQAQTINSTAKTHYAPASARDAQALPRSASATALGSESIEVNLSDIVPGSSFASNAELPLAQFGQRQGSHIAASDTSNRTSSSSPVASVRSAGVTSAPPLRIAQTDPGADQPGTAPSGTPNDVPSGTSPSESTPGSTTPDTTPAGSEPGSSGTDRTSPGTFTPDLSNPSPGRSTRSGPSYIGVGGNIGLGSGNTALGEGSFAIFSKIGLTSNISVRPSVLISDNPTILLPITLDFSPVVTGATADASRRTGLRISPYVGIGPVISTGNDGGVDLLLTGGLDIPISNRFTATAAINASVIDNPAVGLTLGLGYNF